MKYFKQKTYEKQLTLSNLITTKQAFISIYLAYSTDFNVIAFRSIC